MNMGVVTLMHRPLANIRHERFCREYIKTGVASVAYRRAYPNVNSRGAVWVSAHRLIRHDKVKRRIRSLREQIMKRSDITIEKILSDYQYALDMARTQTKPNEMVLAAKEQARLVGLLVERKELGGVGDFENLHDPADVLDKVAREIGPEAAQALGKAFGMSEDVPDKPAQIKGPNPGETIN